MDKSTYSEILSLLRRKLIRATLYSIKNMDLRCYGLPKETVLRTECCILLQRFPRKRDNFISTPDLGRRRERTFRSYEMSDKLFKSKFPWRTVMGRRWRGVCGRHHGYGLEVMEVEAAAAVGTILGDEYGEADCILVVEGILFLGRERVGAMVDATARGCSCVHADAGDWGSFDDPVRCEPFSWVPSLISNTN